jgi:hypothetical protein
LTIGIGYSSLGVALFKLRKSIHTRIYQCSSFPRV